MHLLQDRPASNTGSSFERVCGLDIVPGYSTAGPDAFYYHSQSAYSESFGRQAGAAGAFGIDDGGAGSVGGGVWRGGIGLQSGEQLQSRRRSDRGASSFALVGRPILKLAPWMKR